MTAENKWTDAQWTQYLAEALAANRFPRLVGARLEYIRGRNTCVYADWRDELGQMPENPIYNGGVPVTLADQAACISVIPCFGNLNVVTEELHYRFVKAAPASKRLHALALRASFHTNPHKADDLRLKGATVDVDVFVNDHLGEERYLVGTCSVKVIWLGGPALNA